MAAVKLITTDYECLQESIGRSAQEQSDFASPHQESGLILLH